MTSIAKPLSLIVAFFMAPQLTAIGVEAAAPNLVVFISDDHSYLDSSVAGNEDVRTPNLARLAEDGATFTRAYAASPSCAPSRAALLTGLAPIHNGSMFNHQPPRDEVKKLPAYFQELGYEVVAIGKVAHYDQVKQYGFDHTSNSGFHDDKCIDAALKYLRERESERPLCLMVGTNWPHVPWPKVPESADGADYTLPPSHVDTPETRRWRARYYAGVEKMDRDLGLIYDAAYEKLGDNTLFMHFSDHGAQWPFGKWNLYDDGVHVPFYAVWPGKIERGGKSDAMVSLLDVLPTLVEAAGGQPPENIDGQSLLGLLAGKGDGRNAIYTTHSGDGRMNEYPIRAAQQGHLKYIRNLKPGDEHHTHIDRGKAVDGNGYWPSWVERAKSDEHARATVFRYSNRPAEELYDLEQDPFEQHNLAGDSAFEGQREAMSRALDAWMEEQGDQGLASERAAKDEMQRGRRG